MIYLITNNSELFNRPKNSGIQLCSVQDSLKKLFEINVISADIETTGLNEHTDKWLSLQLGNFENQYIIDIQTINIQQYKELLMDETKLFIWQNGGFDLRFLLKKKLYTKNNYDTYIAENVLTRGLPPGIFRKSLDYLTFKYLNVKLDKTIRNNIARDGFTDRTIRYMADDIKYLEKIKEKQKKEINKYDLKKYLNLENKFVLPLAYVTYCGIYLDQKQWTEKCREDSLNLKKSIDSLNKYVLENHYNSVFVSKQLNLFEKGIKCNILWSSSKQVIKFFDYLKLDTIVYEKGKRKKSVDQKHLSKIKDKHIIIPLYLDYSKKAKLVSTYGEDFLRFVNKNTNRIHTSYNQILTTGRISSGNTDKKEPKNNRPNLQNIPSDKRHRNCFKSQKGNYLIIGDYSQQEPRITADFSQDPSLLEFYLHGDGDTHSMITSRLYSVIEGKEIKIPPKIDGDEKAMKLHNAHPYSKYRQIGKILNLKLDYGGSAYTVKDDLGKTEEEAQVFINALEEAFPKKQEYFNKKIKETFKNGYITTNKVSRAKTFIYKFESFKKEESKFKEYKFWENYKLQKSLNSEEFKIVLKPMVRDYFIKKSNIERNSKNYPTQGTAAEMTKLAIIYFFDWIIENKLLFEVLLCNAVHDEIVVECPENLKQKTKKTLKKCMEDAGKVFCKTIPMLVDPKIIKVWNH